MLYASQQNMIYEFTFTHFSLHYTHTQALLSSFQLKKVRIKEEKLAWVI